MIPTWIRQTYSTNVLQDAGLLNEIRGAHFDTDSDTDTDPEWIREHYKIVNIASPPRVERKLRFSNNSL